jgi:hypothetical protein
MVQQEARLSATEIRKRPTLNLACGRRFEAPATNLARPLVYCVRRGSSSLNFHNQMSDRRETASIS